MIYYDYGRPNVEQSNRCVAMFVPARLIVTFIALNTLKPLVYP